MSNKWVCVVVFKYPSKTNPVVVNVYGYPTKKEAVAHQYRAKKTAREAGFYDEDRVIAIRVRPIIDDEFLAAEGKS